jgi:hypothetical protein
MIAVRCGHTCWEEDEKPEACSGRSPDLSLRRRRRTIKLALPISILRQPLAKRASCAKGRTRGRHPMEGSGEGRML